MPKRRTSWFSLVLVLAMLLSTSVAASAQDSGNDVLLPFVSNDSLPPIGPLAQPPDLSTLRPSTDAMPPSDVTIVIMAQAPAVAYAGGVAGFAATQPAEGEKLNAAGADVVSYAQFLQSSQASVLAAAGAGPNQLVYHYTYALNGFAARLTPAQVRVVEQQPGVLMVLRDEFRYKQQDEPIDADAEAAIEAAIAAEIAAASSDEGATALAELEAAHRRGIKGEDVIVGVIDTGIWPEHPSFADDGSYPPLPITLDDASYAVCDFGNTTANAYDMPFSCNNKLLGARQMLQTYRSVTGAAPDEFDSARDDDGHGTHTASTAAGNAGVRADIYGISRGKVSGIAPRARIIAYKALGNLGGYTSDLAAAIDQAVADGVDVINYSVGGGASLTGADDIAFLFAADAGVFVATSAGNSGPAPYTMGGPATVPWITAVGANNQRLNYEGKVILGNGRTYKGASITRGTRTLPLIDAEFAGLPGTTDADLCIPGDLDPAKVRGKIVLCKRGVNARAAKSLAVAVAGGAGMVLYNTNDVGDLATDTHWVSSVHTDLTPGLAIKDYIATARKPVARIIGGTTDTWRAPVMAIFSSRGPNPIAEDIIKPDVTAPGMQILAGYSPFPDPGSTPPGELFAAIQGTSMSSPYVAGVFALLKQVHPDWSAAMAKSALMTTADPNVLDNDRVTPAGPFTMGAGHVNADGQAYKAFWSQAEIDAASAAEADCHDEAGCWGYRTSAFEPGLVYDAGIYDYLAFLCTAGPEVFGDPEGFCGSLVAAGFSTDPSNLNLASIGIAQLAGSQTISRTVTNVYGTGAYASEMQESDRNKVQEFKVSVKAPQGYTVVVTPSELRLKPGESAEYAVTITNVSAPVDEWRFGSLTWKDKSRQLSVRSPIAVKGALLGTPDEINGAGVDGSAAFDVSFGYTGSYSAAAHGLVPATVLPDTVLQDPDQTFDPTDVVSGAAVLHEFNLSGAAFFRVAIPPEAVEASADLDVYVYNPSGALVASSTKGGTDEQVDIYLPADGTWKVYVHGWATPNGSTDYTLYGWVVSATPGGNLTIDSAPTTAVIGIQATVAVSWTGATAGKWHLGAVSHTGDAGLLALTLVNVDNRPVPVPAP